MPLLLCPALFCGCVQQNRQNLWRPCYCLANLSTGRNKQKQAWGSVPGNSEPVAAIYRGEGGSMTCHKQRGASPNLGNQILERLGKM